MNRWFAGAALFALVGCGRGSVLDILTGPSDIGGIRSELGFLLVASKNYASIGGSSTIAQAQMADRCWQRLMAVLAEGGYGASADSANTRGATIVLRVPSVPIWRVMTDDGRIVTGYYLENGAQIVVSGEFMNFSDPFQILGHEMLHHWCQKALGHPCIRPGTDGTKKEDHDFLTPQGVNIWTLVGV